MLADFYMNGRRLLKNTLEKLECSPIYQFLIMKNDVTKNNLGY